ncbi:MAG: NADH-quinone oxidoreductase subunit N [Gammaproteobacteria bacterium]
MIINTLMLPEILIASLSCFILLWDVFISRKYRITSYIFTQLGLIGIIVSICYNFKNLYITDKNIYFFNNSLTINCQINFFKLIISSFMLMIFIYPIYALVGLESKEINIEASIKYFIIGAVFSGILLYGLSLIYGASGNLNFQVINSFIQTQHVTILFKVGAILVLVAIFFKLNLVPMHMWVPDIYQGAPIPVTMLLATLPKIATVVIFSRIINEVFIKLFNDYWQILLIFISVLSLIIGNIGAILQTNIKRLLAYSAIGHAGFILLGFVTNSTAGRTAANFYVVLYALMAIGLFGVMAMFSKADLEFDEIKDFRGFGKQHPWLGGMLLIILFSMIGFPLTIGFYAKLLIIKSLIDANLILVAIVAVLLSVISLFYYLRIIKAMYFVENVTENSDYNINNFKIFKLKTTWPAVLSLSINGILALGLGVFPVFINSILIYFEL